MGRKPILLHGSLERGDDMQITEYDRYMQPVIKRRSDFASVSIGRCRFKGGSSTTVNNTSTYTPTEYELELQRAQSNYANAIAPNSLYLNDTARQILQNSIGAVQVDFNGLNNAAQNQIANATNGLYGISDINSKVSDNSSKAIGLAYQGYDSLANGNLPSQYLSSMQDAVRSTLQNTMGQSLNSLGQRGVINSSVTNKAMNDISANAADSVAKNYLNNISTVGGILGNQAGLASQYLSNTLSANNANANIYSSLIDSATAPITTAAAAQEAAQQPAINLWNASLGLNGATTGALAAAAGKGTTTSTSKQTQSGGGLFSGLLGGLF